MEENPKTEQSLELDEEQLQAIAGGMKPEKSFLPQTHAQATALQLATHKALFNLATDYHKKLNVAQGLKHLELAANSLEDVNRANAQEQARLQAVRKQKS